MKAAVAAFSLLVIGCSAEQMGIPRLHMSIPAPDRQHVVEVRNEPALDPPEQALWIGRSGGAMHKVRYVSSDGPIWYGPGVWSPDSRLFAFAIADAWIGVADAESGALLYDNRLRGSGVDEEVRSLSFDPASTTLIVEFCARRTRDCREARTLVQSGTPLPSR